MLQASANLSEEHVAALAALRAEHASALQQLREQHAADQADLRRLHETELHSQAAAGEAASAEAEAMQRIAEGAHQEQLAAAELRHQQVGTRSVRLGGRGSC